MDFFELLQPYKGGERLIAMIARLDDRDKHRVLMPVAAAPFAGQLTLVAGKATKVEPLNRLTYLDDGTVVRVFWTAPKVDVVAHFALNTTLLFGDRDGDALSLTELADFGGLVDTMLLNFVDMIDLASLGLPLDGSARRA